jgi:peptide/nickel transport system substrate-binding protein
VDADPAGARRLLAEAGYAGGFEVQLDYLEGSVDAAARALAAQLTAVGLRARPRGAPAAGFLGRVESRDTSLYLLRWVQPSVELQETYTWLLQSPNGPAGTMNGGGYSDQRLDALLEQAGHTRGTKRRAQLLCDATALVRAERPIVPLYRQHDLYAFSETLDFRPEPRRQFSTILRRMRWRD